MAKIQIKFIYQKGVFENNVFFVQLAPKYIEEIGIKPNAKC